MLSAELQRLLVEATSRQREGRLAEAATCLQRVREGAPADAAAWHQGGMIALLAGNSAEAVRLLARAFELNRGALPTAFGLGVARVATGDWKGAEAVLRWVVEAHPTQAEAWHYLALVLKTSGRHAEALAAQRKVVALKPAYAAGWQALGTTLAARGGPTEALTCFDRALQLEPGNLRARLGRAMMRFKMFQVAEAAAEMAEVLARDPREHQARSYRLMALNSLDGFSGEEIFAEHLAFGRALESGAPPVWTHTAEPHRRLRVAFLSPDFREHSVAYFIEPVLRHLDRAAFEIVLYHDHAIVDATTERLRSLVDQFRHFAGQTDDAVENAIRADSPDVLVDLAGHTGGNRLPLFARRLAPVQIAYLGYPNTTGLRDMDYRLVDALTDPAPTADAWHTETLVRFAPTAWAYAPLERAPEPAAPAAGNGAVTFGSFNNLTKLSASTLDLWSKLLREIPEARLLLKAGGLHEPAVREPLVKRLVDAGLDLARVELLTHTPDTISHLALYGRVDVALDMFPYHGTTTTCEALWMGVPVVTLAGDRHASRVGVSLLTAAGHPEWIASTEEEYVHIAAALARDPARRRELRASLRGELQRSPLLDHAAHAAHFGAAVRDAWRRWCSTPAVEPAANASLEPAIL